MTKKRDLTDVAESIPRLERQLAVKETAHQDVEKKIETIYRSEIQRAQNPKAGIEGVHEAGLLGDFINDEIPALEEKNLRLSREISVLTALIEEAREEVQNLAQLEIEKIPKQIAALQASLNKKRESVQRELMEALERVSYLIRRLNGMYILIPFVGKLTLPSLSQEAVIESNLRLDVLLKGQLEESDPYAIEFKIQGLKMRQAEGAEKIASMAMVNARK